MDCEVEDFILISTDKAVRTTSVMGASKRLAEMVLQALRESARERTYFQVIAPHLTTSIPFLVPTIRGSVHVLPPSGEVPIRQ